MISRVTLDALMSPLFLPCYLHRTSPAEHTFTASLPCAYQPLHTSPHPTPLSQIEVLNAATGKTYFFACNAWLKKEGSDTSALRKELLVGSADSAGGEGGGGAELGGTEGGSALRKEMLVGSADSAGEEEEVGRVGAEEGAAGWQC